MGTYTHGSSFHLPIPVIIGSVTIRNVLRLVLEICNHDGGNPIYSTEFEGIREGLTLSSSSDNRYALFKNDTSLTLHVNPFNTTCDNSSIVTWKFKFHLYVQHREYSSSTLISLQCCKYCISSQYCVSICSVVHIVLVASTVYQILYCFYHFSKHQFRYSMYYIIVELI